jgi:hypothetical protein
MNAYFESFAFKIKTRREIWGHYVTCVEGHVDEELSPDQLVDGSSPVEQQLQKGPNALAGKHQTAVGYSHSVCYSWKLFFNIKKM